MLNRHGRVKFMPVKKEQKNNGRYFKTECITRAYHSLLFCARKLDKEIENLFIVKYIQHINCIISLHIGSSSDLYKSD